MNVIKIEQTKIHNDIEKAVIVSLLISALLTKPQII